MPVGVIAVFVGGGLGAVSRYGLSVWAHRALPEAALPWGTFAANIIGCLVLGVLAGVFSQAEAPPWLKLGATTGFLGGLTTFSTFSLESVSLIDAGRPGLAALNVLANLIVGFAFAAAGLWFGARLAG